MLVPDIVCNNDNKLADIKEKSTTTIIDSAPAVQLISEGEINVPEILKRG